MSHPTFTPKWERISRSFWQCGMMLADLNTPDFKVSAIVSRHGDGDDRVVLVAKWRPRLIAAGARGIECLARLSSRALLLTPRIGSQAEYLTTGFPAILVIAFGMSVAAAPLTTAVLGSVDSRHAGSASGLNSAVARVGGMMATALLGGVLGAPGPALVNGFHVVAIVCAFIRCDFGECIFPLRQQSAAEIGSLVRVGSHSLS